jgi:hypothetical protein
MRSVENLVPAVTPANLGVRVEQAAQGLLAQSSMKLRCLQESTRSCPG